MLLENLSKKLAGQLNICFSWTSILQVAITTHHLLFISIIMSHVHSAFVLIGCINKRGSSVSPLVSSVPVLLALLHAAQTRPLRPGSGPQLPRSLLLAGPWCVATLCVSAADVSACCSVPASPALVVGVMAMLILTQRRVADSDTTNEKVLERHHSKSQTGGVWL